MITKKICFILFIFFLHSLKSYSQPKGKVTMEGGPLINKALISNERTKSFGSSTLHFDYSYRYYNTIGSFVKYGYEAPLISFKKWTSYLPLGFSFTSQSTRYEKKGYLSGCFYSEEENDMKVNNRNSINVSLGQSLQYENKKIRVTISNNLTKYFILSSSTRSMPFNSSDSFNDNYTSNISYLSSQLALSYKLAKGIWIGPSCEITYCNRSYLAYKILRPLSPRIFYYYYFTGNDIIDPATDISGRFIWIHPSLKLQIDLR